MAKTIKTRVQHKRAVEADWALATNFVPLAGELIVYEVDETHAVPRIKIGDGETKVNDLGFVDSGITTGTTDPDANVDSQFYFKYSDN